MLITPYWNLKKNVFIIKGFITISFYNSEIYRSHYTYMIYSQFFFFFIPVGYCNIVYNYNKYVTAVIIAYYSYRYCSVWTLYNVAGLAYFWTVYTHLLYNIIYIESILYIFFHFTFFFFFFVKIFKSSWVIGHTKLR